MSITKEDITKVKGKGFLQNRGTECFSGRVVSIGGKFSAHQLKVIAECAEKFGNGNTYINPGTITLPKEDWNRYSPGL